MENDKKYNIVLGLMIFFFVILVGVCLAFGLGFIVINTDENNNVNENIINSEIENIKDKEENVVENNKDDDNSTSDIDNDTKQLSISEKKKLLNVWYNSNEYKGKCFQGDCDLYLKVYLPKIELKTETVDSINSKIEDIYEATNKYYVDNDKKIYSYNISSKYGYIEKWDCIYIEVNKAAITEHASGYPSEYTFIYNVDNDKEISLKELLESKDITSSELEKKFKSSEGYNEAKRSSFSDNLLELDNKIKNGINDGMYIYEIAENFISVGIQLTPGDIAIATFSI